MDNGVQVIGQGLPNVPIYRALLKFIDEKFSVFPFPIKEDGSFEKNEDQITKALCMFLESEQEKITGNFRFINQDNKSDIGVVQGRNYVPQNTKAFFYIEAKRLPTPSNSKRDPTEYVYIHSPLKGHGGIDRFKTERHAKGCSVVAMVGYIQDNKTPIQWKNKINSMIQSLADENLDFSTNDKLHVKKIINKRFRSIHMRKSGTEIEIWHFFEKEK